MENHLNSESGLAWAAGVFEGEGSATSHLNHGRKRAEMFVYQAGRDDPPELLQHFHQVVGCGSVMGPYRGRLWCWRTAHPTAIAKVITSLWPWLGVIKRAQIMAMTDAVSTLWFMRTVGELWDMQPAVERSARPDASGLAWAAGLFAGEGSVWLGRGRYRQVQASITQASGDGVPDVLLRFREAVLGVGTINGPYTPTNSWSRLPQYRWQVGSFEGVQAVVALLWPWLGPPKRAQARTALIDYAALGAGSPRTIGA